MAKKSLSAREVLSDIRSGMDDRQLMARYRLSAQGLQSLFNKMVKNGVISREELDERVPSIEKTVELGFICTACGNIQASKFQVCPRCGFEAPDYSKKSGDKARRVDIPKKASAGPRTSGKRTLSQPDMASSKAKSGPGAGDGEQALSGLAGAGKLLRTLGVVSVGVYLLVVICLFVIIKFMPTQAVMSSAQLMLAVFVLQLPVLVMVMATFVSMRILSEATRAFIQVSKRPGR